MEFFTSRFGVYQVIPCKTSKEANGESDYPAFCGYIESKQNTEIVRVDLHCEHDLKAMYFNRDEHGGDIDQEKVEFPYHQIIYYLEAAMLDRLLAHVHYGSMNSYGKIAVHNITNHLNEMTPEMKSWFEKDVFSTHTLCPAFDRKDQRLPEGTFHELITAVGEMTSLLGVYASNSPKHPWFLSQWIDEGGEFSVPPMWSFTTLEELISFLKDRFKYSKNLVQMCCMASASDESLKIYRTISHDPKNDKYFSNHGHGFDPEEFSSGKSKMYNQLSDVIPEYLPNNMFNFRDYGPYVWLPTPKVWVFAEKIREGLRAKYAKD